MATETSERILIVGAGMAGVTMARTLADAGAAVVVTEKGRTIGGRMASRRTDHGTFDHGAQYVTGKSPPFRAVLTGLSNKGTVAYWKPTGRDRTLEWHVGVPSMNEMLWPLTGGYDLRTSTTVARIERDGEGLAVGLQPHGEDEATERFDRVLLTVPAPQGERLIGHLGAPFDRFGEASYAPCWTLMAAFAERLGTEHDVHRLDPGDPSPIDWAARNSRKPEREGSHDLWVANGAPDWTRANLERERDEVVPDLLAALGNVLGLDLPEPAHAAAHRWRYSRVERPLGEPFLLSDDGRLGACGDWCLAPRVEAAFESGRALADAVKGRL